MGQVDNKATPEYVKELTTDLYYDILEKYVALQADLKRSKATIKKLQFENNQLKSDRDPNAFVRYNNSNVDLIKGIVYKHKEAYKEALMELENLKVKNEEEALLATTKA